MSVVVKNDPVGDTTIWLCCDSCGQREAIAQHPVSPFAVKPTGWGKRKSKEKDHQLTGEYITEDLCPNCWSKFQADEYKRWIDLSNLPDGRSQSADYAYRIYFPATATKISWATCATQQEVVGAVKLAISVMKEGESLSIERLKTKKEDK